MNKTTTKEMMIVQRQTILSKKSKYNYNKRQSSSHKLGETYAKINNTYRNKTVRKLLPDNSLRMI